LPNAVIPAKRSASRNPARFCGNVLCLPQKESLDSRPGLLSAGVTFFRGNDAPNLPLIRLLSGTNGQTRDVCERVFPQIPSPKSICYLKPLWLYLRAAEAPCSEEPAQCRWRGLPCGILFGKLERS
jgi:hypothetical protein